MTGFDCALRVVGPVNGARRLVNAAASFAGYARCDERFQVQREAYLSAFTFDDAMLGHFNANHGSTAGYAGSCHADWLWVDIDRPSVADALTAARRLVGVTLERYRTLDPDAMLLFISGSKGFHVGLPVGIFGPAAIPSPTFHATARKVAEALATAAGVEIDTSVYDRVRLFRAPNSRHPKTGRFKRFLTHGELSLTADRIVELAAEPMPFDVPDPPSSPDDIATADWNASSAAVAAAQRGEANRTEIVKINASLLQRVTVDTINGVDTPDAGDRNLRFFRCAANLAEHGTPAPVIAQLLDNPGRNSGLAPAELGKAVRSGTEHSGRQRKAVGGG